MLQGEACATVGARQENRERVLMAEEDSALITRFVRGDAAAFDLLFSRYQDYVYHILYGVVGNADEARDLTQDVFVQVYRSLPRFRHGSRFATWLYRVALNRAVDAARTAKRRSFLPFFSDGTPIVAEDEAEEPEAIFLRGEERTEIQKILMQCPVSHRQALVLRYYRDLSIEEMAEVMSCSASAAKVRLHRARKVFKECYEKAQSAQPESGKENRDAPQTVR